ncbi:uncharacterized protein A4U43_C01F28380 [Asparagus officinalis]|uniref:Uncharacterized protein n=1 Tax=Asparagus officinalis TaxID=4686 RepID=A0A5P1FST8_ASPOF|nr:uncharacterized protein A4U43_C01F28380 [Asparagus officinalis]
MGLSTNLADVSSESIPIIILISAVRGAFSYIRYLVLCLVTPSPAALTGQSPPPSIHPPPALATGERKLSARLWLDVMHARANTSGG